MRPLIAVVLSLLTGSALASEPDPRVGPLYGPRPPLGALKAGVKPPELNDVGIDQRLNEPVPLDLRFRDESGRDVKLGDYFQGKPVILVLAYFRCPMLCTQVLNGLVSGLRGVTFDIGREFDVVTVSFDPRDTPELAAAKKQSYVADYGRPDAGQGWHFLTGEPAAIERLAQAVGFRYYFDDRRGEFAHGSGIMILTPQGKIARYFFGINFNPRDLRLGLVEAADGHIGSPVDQVMLYCFHYDAAIGRYTTAVLTFVRLGGLLVVASLAGFVWLALRRERQKKRADALVS